MRGCGCHGGSGGCKEGPAPPQGLSLPHAHPTLPCSSRSGGAGMGKDGRAHRGLEGCRSILRAFPHCSSPSMGTLTLGGLTHKYWL